MGPERLRASAPLRTSWAHCRPRPSSERVSFVQDQRAELRAADPRRILQHLLEHRLQLAGRAADDLSTSDVAVCCSSDSVRSRVRACTSSNSRTFSIAITAWSAKVVTSSICLAGERLDGRGGMTAMTPIGIAFAQQAARQAWYGKPPRLTNSRQRVIRSASTSGMWTVRASSAGRPDQRIARPGPIALLLHPLLIFGGEADGCAARR